uniref:endonuclease/exonuclease/phosphatase family protein n=1 Tax=Marinobacterium profundum TaxID=1714300 RepID=UPI00082FE322|nr:endonuclease/exonuclease/phosphatase family protein [Marinobacterium profundum]
MPFYSQLKFWRTADRSRTIDNLLALRKSLQSSIPRRTLVDTLLLATWNLRDFDSNKFKHGPRLPESFFYIAEVISAFDLVALQEVNRNLAPFKKLMHILGNNWSYITTDVTEGRSGNGERMTFVYDTRKVWFEKMAGEIVLPKSALIEGNEQFARSPYIVSFQSGWFKFNLCTVHLYYGSTSGTAYQRRVAEIAEIGKFLAKRAARENLNVILLGDLNIVKPDDDTMTALKKSGFIVPESLVLPTNMLANRYYDQIAFLCKDDELELGDSDQNAGVFNLFNSIYRPGDTEIYHKITTRNAQWPGTAEARTAYFREKWRTWQMSDHLPLWIELKINFADKYLKHIQGKRG